MSDKAEVVPIRPQPEPLPAIGVIEVVGASEHFARPDTRYGVGMQQDVYMLPPNTVIHLDGVPIHGVVCLAITHAGNRRTT